MRLVVEVAIKVLRCFTSSDNLAMVCEDGGARREFMCTKPKAPLRTSDSRG